MRMMKKGGAPRDRRIDRRKVAMAAAAVFFLFATAVQAQPPVDFLIDSNRSWLSIDHGGFQQGSAPGDNGPNDHGGQYTPGMGFTPQTAQDSTLVNPGIVPGGSMYSPLRGHVFAGVNPGASIQFYATGTHQMELATTGNYIPGENGLGQTDPNAAAEPGNFGAQLSLLSAFVRQFGMIFDSPVSLAPPNFTSPTPLPISGGSHFNATGIVLPIREGYEDIVTGVGVGPYHIKLKSNIPVNYFDVFDQNGVEHKGVDTSQNGTINPTTFHLVIPVSIQIWNSVTVGNNIDYQVTFLTGQIVADPYVPEPSTMVLAGFGIVGLLSYAWRARKRKALVA